MTKDSEHQNQFKVSDRRGENKDQESKKASEASTPSEDQKAQNTPSSIDFSHFILSLSTSAMIHMGFMEDPHTGKKDTNLTMARHEIDVIEMLAEKTKGNLSQQEEQVLSQMLYRLRMGFVEANK